MYQMLNLRCVMISINLMNAYREEIYSCKIKLRTYFRADPAWPEPDPWVDASNSFQSTLNLEAEILFVTFRCNY